MIYSDILRAVSSHPVRKVAYSLAKVRSRMWHLKCSLPVAAFLCIFMNRDDLPAGCMHSIPGWGAKILKAVQHSQKNKILFLTTIYVQDGLAGTEFILHS